jgi:hypothetical protein
MQGRLEVRLEEEGTLWAWRWPELVWSSPLKWLFAPCEYGPNSWAGDLWAVDASGQLVIVESKLVKKRSRRADPFADFARTDQGLFQHVGRPKFTVDKLRQRWRWLLEREQRLPRADHDPEPGGKKNIWGVLPYSRRRTVLREWPDLARDLTEIVHSDEYENSCEHYLSIRTEGGEPPPHYVGLFVISGDAMPLLSKNGVENLENLIGTVGEDHVHAVSIYGVRDEHDLAIESEQPMDVTKLLSDS